MFVDDVEAQAVGPQATVVEVMTRACRDLADVLERQLGYPLAREKSVIANDDATAADIVRATDGKAGVATNVTSKLGIEYTCGRARPKTGGPRRLRYGKQWARRRRLGRLKRLGCKITQVVKRGLVLAASYGGSVRGTSDHELGILNLLTSNATAPNTRGTSRTLKLLITDLPAVSANGNVITQWAAAIWRACGPRGQRRRTDPTPNLMEAAIKKANRLLDAQGKTWSAIRGPAGAAILTARRLGWSFLGGLRVVDERGCQLDMGCTDPKSIRTAADRATRAGAAISAATKLGLRDADSGVWDAPVRRALSSKSMAPMAKSCLRRAFAGGCWSKARRFAEGLCADELCDKCGKGPDHDHHRI